MYRWLDNDNDKDNDNDNEKNTLDCDNIHRRNCIFSRIFKNLNLNAFAKT